MLTLFAFIFTLGLLVTIHEYGHFIVARLFDVKVLKFSIGFGKPLWRTHFGKDRTELIVAAIPLGGYVKMLDERELQDEPVQNNYSKQELSRAFNRLPVLKKIAVVVAGPVANLLLAIFLYWLLFMLGTVGLKPVLGEIPQHSAAAVAGLKRGDLIQTVNGKKMHSWQDVRWEIFNQSVESQSVRLEVLRENYGLTDMRLATGKIDYEDQKEDFLNRLGMVARQPVVAAKIGEILKNSAAEQAGLKTDDVVVKVNSENIATWERFVEIVQGHPNQRLSLKVIRGSQTIDLTVKPESVENNEKFVGRIGASVQVNQADLDQFFVVTHYSATASLLKATKKTWDTSIFSLKMLGKMFTGDISWKMMSGPVTIANYAGQSAHMGVKIFIGFLALISISIGVLNLLPIPVLDGGHLMYYMVEIFTGRPVSEQVMLVGQKIGLFLIGSMMVLAFYNDINRFIIG